MPRSGKEFDAIGFQLLASAPAVSTLASDQFVVDFIFVDGESGGKPIDQGENGFAVRFSRGPVSEHNELTRGEEKRAVERVGDFTAAPEMGTVRLPS